MARFKRIDAGAWRRIAAASWRPPQDPTILGSLTLDARPVSAYIARLREQTGVRVTVTHIVGRALARALGECPEINGRLVGTRFYLRDTVDVFFQIVASSENGDADLSGAKIEGADHKSTWEIAKELSAKAEAVRARKDAQFEKTKKTARKLPGPFLRLGLWFANWCDTHGIALRGLPRDPFGSAMVTNVGMFGIDVGYAPLFPVGGPPIVVLVGAITDEPACVDGRVIARPTLRLHATFDHRFVDGYHAGALARAMRRVLDDPAQLDPPLPLSVVS
jgi:pyruvate dehydrogenase E2 component (dihydrolipoamide acetyltransferase)